MSLPHMMKFFVIIRNIDPIQRLAVGIWSQTINFDNLLEIEKIGLENSDIITYHNYNSYENNVEEMHLLKKLGRPVINTEWLNRPDGNNVEELFPLFFLEKIGCYNWGLVAGKYQTFEPHNSIWDGYKANPKYYENYDFSKWMHDLYRPSLNPYVPREIDLIKKFSALADKDFAARNENTPKS